MTTIKEYKAMMEGATDAPWYGFNASFSREKMIAFSVISNDESGANIATEAEVKAIEDMIEAEMQEIVEVVLFSCNWFTGVNKSFTSKPKKNLKKSFQRIFKKKQTILRN